MRHLPIWHALCSLPARQREAPGTGWGVANRPDGVQRAPGDTAMTMMDFWYDRAIYEMADLNEEATGLRREAEEALSIPSTEQADEEDE